MIAALIAILYITVICYVTGCALAEDRKGSILACFTGLAFHGIVFTGISVFFPVGTITAQIILLASTTALYFWRRPGFSVPAFALIHPLVTICCTVAILIMLLLNAAPINHPDTLAYHAQNIRWSAAYAAVPGVANIEYHLGLQSSMFVLSALFSFPFTGNAGLGFANLAVCSWLVIFVFSRIANARTFPALLPWLLLTAFLFWSFTQIRLSVSSGSVDFIAAIFVWLCLYRAAAIKSSPTRGIITELLLLITFAVSIKLSVAPLLLLVPWLLLRIDEKVLVKWILLPLFTVALLVPILTRNSIASGYPLMPANFISLSVDWKADPTEVSLQQQYIRSYARTGIEADAASIIAASKETIGEWLPRWWIRLSPADQTLLISLLLFGPLAIAAAVRNPKDSLSYITFTAIAGCLFWFTMAPDPRFGYGFLIPLAAVGLTQLMNVLISRKPATTPATQQQHTLQNITRSSPENIATGKRADHTSHNSTIRFRNLCMTLMIAALIIFGYHRVTTFFSIPELLRPAGIPAAAFHRINCNGIPLVVPDVNNFCGDSPLPCGLNCPSIESRGPALQDGFRLKPKQ